MVHRHTALGFALGFVGGHLADGGELKDVSPGHIINAVENGRWDHISTMVLGGVAGMYVFPAAVGRL